MANPFGWQQVQLKDTGIASQAGIRTAQQAVTNIGNTLEDMAADRNQIQDTNIAAQKVLNNQDYVNRIKGYTSLDDMSAEQAELTPEAQFQKYGVNFDQTAAKQALNNQQAELAATELNRLAQLPKVAEEMDQYGVGGFNTNKSRILAHATSTEQRDALTALVDTQLATVMQKQNKNIITDTLKMFGGAQNPDSKAHSQALQAVEDRALREGYTPAQVADLIKQYKGEEAASAELTGVEKTKYDDGMAVHNSRKDQVNTYLTTEIANQTSIVQQALSARDEVDMRDSTLVESEIAAKYATGASAGASAEQYSNAFRIIQKLGAQVPDGDGGTEALSAGRARAIFAQVVKSGIDISDNDAVTEAVKHQIANNVTNYSKSTREFDTAQHRLRLLQDNMLAVNNESKTYGIKGRVSAQKDTAWPSTPILDSIESEVVGRFQQGERILNQQIANTQTGSNTEQATAQQAPVDLGEQRARSQEQLETTFSKEELATQKAEGAALVKDDAYQFLSTEMDGTNPILGNFRFDEQDAALRAAGYPTAFTLPSNKINAGDYVAQAKTYINDYNKLGIVNSKGQAVLPSTAAGPFQLVATGIDEAIQAGVISTSDPMDTQTQAKVATYLLARNPSIEEYLTTPATKQMTIAKRKALDAEALQAFGKIWVGVTTDSTKGRASLEAMRKQVANQVARAKAKGTYNSSVLRKALMPKSLQRKGNITAVSRLAATATNPYAASAMAKQQYK